MNKDFAGSLTPPLVAGSLHGLRSFEVTSEGDLEAVSWPYTWTNGENIATCHIVPRRLFGKPTSLQPEDVFSEQEIAKFQNHDISKCPSHGFYAYTDGGIDFHFPNNIEGVIEGYGVVHEGTRGFRAEKARIVALHMPGTFPASKNASIKERLHALRDMVGIGSLIPLYLAYVAFWVLGTLNFSQDNWIVNILCVLSMMAGWFCLWLTWGRSDIGSESFRRYYFKKKVGISRRKAYALVKEKYPDATIFDNRADMLAHYGLKG